MKFLVTGAAGFIGMHMCIKLLEKNFSVVGIDNLNSYYSNKLKKDRLKILKRYKKFKFFKVDIIKKKKKKKIFSSFPLTHVIHLAAQAGVRYSIDKPDVYTNTNLVGTFNILDLSKKYKIKHLLMASSSSVYGGNKETPFKENTKVDNPISYYAATKKSNEIMAHSYSHLFRLPITCLRFFTVYGPWGRPDMSLFLFTKAILENKFIKIFNKGKMHRDFTYIDDIVESILKLSLRKFKDKNKKTPYQIINIGSDRPVNLMTYIKIIEKNLQKKAKKIFMPMQPGDVSFTHASLKQLKKLIKYQPKTKLEDGIRNFLDWYQEYYGKK